MKTLVGTIVVVVLVVIILAFSLAFAKPHVAPDERVAVVPAYLQAAKLYEDVTKYTDLGPLSHRTGSLELSRSMDWMQDRLKGAGATVVKREPVLQIENAFLYNNDCNLTLKPVCDPGGKLHLCKRMRVKHCG